MNTLIVRSQRFLDRPLGLGPRGLLLVSAFLIFPWRLGVFRGGTTSGSGSWVPFALGVLALLLLRACVQGKVRDLVDVAVLSFYFSVFLSWSSGPGSILSLPLVVSFLLAAALITAWYESSADEIAEMQSAG
jgi:hypothetical protein